MINIHLNGEMVRCPDIKQIKEDLQRIRIKNFICPFGEIESACQTWTEYQSLKPQERLNKHCDLCQALKNPPGLGWIPNIYTCPKARERYLNSLKPKHFTINGSVYRKLSSSAHKLVKETKNRTLFITLTFPKYKLKKYGNNGKKHNEAFSKFMLNLHNNYDVVNYVAVRERGKVGNRYHFHLLCDIKFIDFIKLNRSWNAAISDIAFPSKNSLTTKRKTRFVNNPFRALRYVCKYFSKAKRQGSESRLVFISHSLTVKPIREFLGFSYFCTHYNLTCIHQNEYNTLYRINDHKEFERFCNEYLYPAFELSEKKTNFYDPGRSNSG